MTGAEHQRPVDVDMHALDEQYRRQAAWFAGVRSDLLRRVGIRAKRQVLELGCGTGAVTPELTRRCGGRVVALDLAPGPLGFRPERFAGASRVTGAGERLPFPDRSFDLVFTQMLFLWAANPATVAREAGRVLKSGCELVLAAEPDYGGRIEHPAACALGPRISAALSALGADPQIARKMPAILSEAGFRVDAGVHPSLFQPDELPGAWQAEERFLAALEGRPVEPAPPASFLYMPYFWFLARKP